MFNWFKNHFVDKNEGVNVIIIIIIIIKSWWRSLILWSYDDRWL